MTSGVASIWVLIFFFLCQKKKKQSFGFIQGALANARKAAVDKSVTYFYYSIANVALQKLGIFPSNSKESECYCFFPFVG